MFPLVPPVVPFYPFFGGGYPFWFLSLFLSFGEAHVSLIPFWFRPDSCGRLPGRHRLSAAEVQPPAALRPPESGEGGPAKAREGRRERCEKDKNQLPRVSMTLKKGWVIAQNNGADPFLIRVMESLGGDSAGSSGVFVFTPQQMKALRSQGSTRVPRGSARAAGWCEH